MHIHTLPSTFLVFYTLRMKLQLKVGQNKTFQNYKPSHGGDKVRILAYTHPHKPPGKMKWPSDNPLMCGMMSDLVIFKHRKDYCHA